MDFTSPHGPLPSYFSPNGPEVPTVAVLRHDIDEGLDVEIQRNTSGDEARDARSFLDFVRAETSDAGDGRICRDILGIEPDADNLEAYADEIEAVRRTYGRWNRTAVDIAVACGRR